MAKLMGPSSYDMIDELFGYGLCEATEKIIFGV